MTDQKPTRTAFPSRVSSVSPYGVKKRAVKMLMQKAAEEADEFETDWSKAKPDIDVGMSHLRKKGYTAAQLSEGEPELKRFVHLAQNVYQVGDDQRPMSEVLSAWRGIREKFSSLRPEARQLLKAAIEELDDQSPVSLTLSKFKDSIHTLRTTIRSVAR